MVGIVVLVVGVAISAEVFFSEAAVGRQLSFQEKIDSLFNKLKTASEQEMLTGELEDTPQGKVFAGESAKKMEQLNKDVQKEYDALIARPESERQNAMDEIKRFVGDSNLAVNYDRTSQSSYNADIPVEIYTVGKDQYEIDARNNTIIQFGPRPLPIGEEPEIADTTPRYSSQQLEVMARQFIVKQAPGVQISKLAPHHGDKDGVNYFFRWEDTSRKVEDMPPFIQVGFSRGGSLLSYTNSLGL